MESFKFFVLGQVTQIKSLYNGNVNELSYYGYSHDASVTSKGRFMVLNCNSQLPINTMVTFSNLSATVDRMVGFALDIRLFINVIKYEKFSSSETSSLKQEAIKSFIEWLNTAMHHIQDYNENTEAYSIGGFQGNKLQCVNAIFNGDMPNTRQYNTILCKLQQYNYHKTSKQMDCYVFNCRSAKKRFSVITWRIDGKFKKIFDNKLICDSPIIFANLKFDERLNNKPYFQTCNNSIIFHNWCQEICNMLLNGKNENYGVSSPVDTYYIWMDQGDAQVEDVRFYQDIKIPEFTNFIKAVSYAKDQSAQSQDGKAKAIFLLRNKNIISVSGPGDMDAYLKHYCNYCKKVYESFDPVCQHVKDNNPWLEIKLKLQFKHLNESQTLDVVVLLNAIKSMWKLCQRKDAVDVSDTLDFILNTFENQQQWRSSNEARYFIPIVSAFFKENLKSDAITSIQITRSRNYCTYYISDVKMVRSLSEAHSTSTAVKALTNGKRKDVIMSDDINNLEPDTKKRKLN